MLINPDMNKCSFMEYKACIFEKYLMGTGNRLSGELNHRIVDVNFSESVNIIKTEGT